MPGEGTGPWPIGGSAGRDNGWLDPKNTRSGACPVIGRYRPDKAQISTKKVPVSGLLAGVAAQ